jgi:glycosyltransferase involved in cell wall biosynthesis
MNKEYQEPMVSICMPVFNGEHFITAAIDSLMSLDYENYELIILDNNSTDKTGEICKLYSKRYKKIRYFLDDNPCTSHQAASRLVNYANGDFFMLACDDDIWDKNFLKKIMPIFQQNPSVGLVYPRFGLIDSKGFVIDSSAGGIFIDANHSRFNNFIRYLFKRSCVPLVFGVFRLENYKYSLPFRTFDNTLWDGDNLFLLKFLSNFKVHCVDETLFYYREKNRFERPDGSTDARLRIKMPKNFFIFNLLYIAHQIKFLREIFIIINKSSFCWVKKIILKFASVLSLFFTILVATLNSLSISRL